MLTEALKVEILSARAITYRRNTLALAVVLLALCRLSNVNFKDLSFFGVKIEPDTAGNRTLVLQIVAALLTYHALFFAYYAWRDGRNWWRDASEADTSLPGRQYFPELQMFFGWPPRKPETHAQPSGLIAENWRQVNANMKCVTWAPIIEPPPSAGMTLYTLRSSQVRQFKEQFSWLAVVDVGLPLLLFVCAVVAWRIS